MSRNTSLSSQAARLCGVASVAVFLGACTAVVTEAPLEPSHSVVAAPAPEVEVSELPSEPEILFEQVGTASWYGPGFHGRTTASGEIYDQYAMTAAHRELDLPTTIEVTNLANGETVELRVNDRGPYAGNRVLDVSMAAAEVLGFKEAGLTEVRIRVLSVGSDTEIVDPLVSGFRAPQIFLQAGAFDDVGRAEALRTQIASTGPVGIDSVDVNGTTYHRVRLGPYETLAEAEEAASILRDDARTPLRVMMD